MKACTAVIPVKRVVIGTNNRDKLKELKAMLGRSRTEVLSLADFSKCADVVENGRTFEANARKKAFQYSRHVKGLTLADDSGLSVFALNGKPGVYSARFAGAGCTYADNNEKLLTLLAGKTKSKRRAKFVCVMALYDSGRFVATAKGECFGFIAESVRGDHGFGYDPVFIPDGFSKTFAELSPHTKNRLSHRGKALRAARKEILSYLRRKL